MTVWTKEEITKINERTTVNQKIDFSIPLLVEKFWPDEPKLFPKPVPFA